jgi:transcriptional regulator with XRE-family HTH domain
MPPKESALLIEELKAWCDEKYGRRAELARKLGVSRQLVSDWFAGRTTPTLDAGLQIQELLRKERRSKPRDKR